MAEKHLGPVFDIHGGGIDLVFPHHENEIAQSRCAHGTPVMARTWLHNGYLQVEGEKMSKSLGNFITIHELLAHWKGYAWPGEALRFNMLRTHYRQPLDWTFHSLDESHKILWDWYGALDGVRPTKRVPAQIVDALRDDLNVPQAITELHKLRADGDNAEMLAALRFLGFSGDRRHIARVAGAVGRASGNATVVGVRSSNEIDELIAARLAARRSKDFKEADRLRDKLSEMGVVLKDSKDPKTGEPLTTWEAAR
jgi:cysteinyl-tRNA synthetase